jgi:hypothetical protein
MSDPFKEEFRDLQRIVASEVVVENKKATTINYISIVSFI